MKPTIYFFCYDAAKPAGGVKVIYQHVDILNAHGFHAAVLHHHPGFRCQWFANTTRIIALPELTMKSHDYLVIPEDCFSDVAGFASHVNKVVFNQGCYNTFLRGYSFDTRDCRSPYRDPLLKAVIVVSEDSKQYLNYAFPGLKVMRVHNAIDAALFSFPSAPKKKQLCLMVNKNPADALQVINIVKFRGVLDPWAVVPIANVTEETVARILKESMLFLQFAYHEGFSLPPAEAMACGCVVIGYHGMGGREFFRDDLVSTVPHGDIIAFARTLEEVLTLCRTSPDALCERGRRASEFILSTYSREQQERDVVACWKAILM